MPEATALAALRRDIDRKPHKIKRVLMDASIQQAFFGEVADEAKAVKAFTNQHSNRSNALKKHPKVGTLISFSRKNRVDSLEWHDRNFPAVAASICRAAAIHSKTGRYCSNSGDHRSRWQWYAISVHTIYVTLHQYCLMELSLGEMNRYARQSFPCYQRLSLHELPRPSTDRPW